MFRMIGPNFIFFLRSCSSSFNEPPKSISYPSSNDAIQASNGASKSAIEMENHVYLKAKSKDQYLGFVARLILHVREMSR